MQVTRQDCSFPRGQLTEADAVRAAVQIFEDGLVRIWAQADEGASGAEQLIASIARRVSAMALRATVRSAQSGAAGGGFANAAADVKDIGARVVMQMAAADAATAGRRLDLAGDGSIAAASRIDRRSRAA